LTHDEYDKLKSTLDKTVGSDDEQSLLTSLGGHSAVLQGLDYTVELQY